MINMALHGMSAPRDHYANRLPRSRGERRHPCFELRGSRVGSTFGEPAPENPMASRASAWLSPLWGWDSVGWWVSKRFLARVSCVSEDPTSVWIPFICPATRSPWTAGTFVCAFVVHSCCLIVCALVVHFALAPLTLEPGPRWHDVSMRPYSRQPPDKWLFIPVAELSCAVPSLASPLVTSVPIVTRIFRPRLRGHPWPSPAIVRTTQITNFSIGYHRRCSCRLCWPPGGVGRPQVWAHCSSGEWQCAFAHQEMYVLWLRVCVARSVGEGRAEGSISIVCCGCLMCGLVRLIACCLLGSSSRLIGCIDAGRAGHRSCRWCGPMSVTHSYQLRSGASLRRGLLAQGACARHHARNKAGRSGRCARNVRVGNSAPPARTGSWTTTLGRSTP